MPQTTLLSKPNCLPTKMVQCPTCDGWGVLQQYTNSYNPNALTKEVCCECCEGQQKIEVESPFIVYSPEHGFYLGWQDYEDEVLPKGVSYCDAWKFGEWEDSVKEISDFVERYKIQPNTLVYIQVEEAD